MIVNVEDDCTYERLAFREFEDSHDRAIFHRRFSICCLSGRSQIGLRRSLRSTRPLLNIRRFYPDFLRKK